MTWHPCTECDGYGYTPTKGKPQQDWPRCEACQGKGEQQCEKRLMGNLKDVSEQEPQPPKTELVKQLLDVAAILHESLTEKELLAILAAKAHLDL